MRFRSSRPQRSRGGPWRRARPRRHLLLLALAAAAIAVFLAAAPPSPPNHHGAEVLRFDIRSRLVPGWRHEVAVVPPNSTGRNRPLLVFLHGRGSDGENSNLSSQMFAALARQGREAPDIVFADGGEASYWHDRAGGRWGSYVLDDVIPVSLRRLGADNRRVAIGGLSMGGFGALDLARLSPGRFCAVGADSAALWKRAAHTAPGAFDDAADFAHHDLLALARRGNLYRRTPVWLDVGTEDPFRAADTALVGELRARGANVRFHVWPGGHGGDYWRAHLGRYLSFYARALARCTA